MNTIVSISIAVSLIAIIVTIWGGQIVNEIRWGYAQSFRADELKQRVLSDAGLSGSFTPREADVAIRDYVYRTNIVGYGDTHLVNDAHRYASLGKPGAEMLCDGMAASQVWALTQLGIPARETVIASERFLSGEEYGDTHVVVEVYLDGQWEISDPTFNVSVNCSDGNAQLSVSEAVACIKAGKKLVPVPGKAKIAGRRVQDYYLPYPSLFAAFKRAPIAAKKLVTERQQFPFPGWMAEAKALYR